VTGTSERALRQSVLRLSRLGSLAMLLATRRASSIIGISLFRAPIDIGDGLAGRIPNHVATESTFDLPGRWEAAHQSGELCPLAFEAR
jgi:hypothetical protein